MTDQSTNLNLLTIQIGDKDTSRQAYLVRVTLGDGSAAGGWLSLAGLPPAPTRISEGNLAQYGGELFKRLFSGSLHGLFRQAWIAAQRSRDVLHLQLWIASDDSELQLIPWELLHMCEENSDPVPLAATPQVAFSRYLDSSAPFGQPIERWPLRVLVVIGAPNDLETRWPDMTAINYAQESTKLITALSTAGGTDRIKYQFVHPATPEAFVKFLDEGYHLVIFYGHGLYEPRMGTSLMMERDDGSSRLFAAADLIDALRYTSSRPVLFILISCNTAAQRANPALDNLAIQIVRDGSVPAVVAMRDLVEVDLARAFTQYLCDHLLRYGAIDRAVSAARRQVMSAHSAGWSTPVLYMRSRDGRLFEPNAQLEFARLLSNDPQIRPTALSAPAGARLALLRARPDDQPNPQDARTLLVQLLALTTYPETAPLVVVSGGSRISRSLLLQQLAWQHNRLRIADASPVAIYLALADDRSLQAGARIVDLLIDAAAAQDPAYGLALMNLLANSSTSNQLKFVLLIDGFESLSEAMRPSMAEVFSILARRNPALRIAVSVEESDAPAALCRDTIPWLILQPLSERQIRAYIAYRDQKNAFQMLERIIRGDMRSLASDPQLLTAITEELTIRDSSALSRETLLSGLLERLITRSAGPTATRTVVNDCLYALAWRLHWSYRRSLPISEALQIMRDVLEERSFVPEEVYRALVAAGALVEIGGAWVQLSHLDIQAYIAVQSLCRRSDILAFLEDIVVMACFPNRLAWWSPVLVGVAQRADNLRDLEPIWRMLRSEVSGSQAVLAARCLGAFMQAQGQSRNALARLTASSNEDTQLSDLIDSILIELDPRFEPSAVTRAQLAEALGQLALPKVHTALRRQIFERILLIDDLWQYDRPIVRIAAARALRDIDLNDPHDLQIDVLRKAWRSYTVQPLLDTLQSPDRSIEERIFAAFALGDLCDQSEVRSNLVKLLLSEDDLGPKKEWQAIQATIADALILEADAMLARLLATELQKVSALSRRTKILVINIVGVCAGYQPFLIEWLYNEIDVAPIPLISGIACMALARVIACGEGDELHGDISVITQKLEAQARRIIDEPITVDAPMVATLRRLAIETLVWLGKATANSDPPESIASWPVALRQSWWDSITW